jgi:hypothetical protein
LEEFVGWIQGTHSLNYVGALPYHVFLANYLHGALFDPEDEGDRSLRNVCELIPVYMALHPRINTVEAFAVFVS